MSIRLLQGDCREVLATLDAGSIDACVTDPPYHLTAGKPGGTGVASLNLKSPAGRSRIGTGFMGKAWDGGDVAFQPETWAEVLRVLKPGAHLLAFGGTRTYHRLACAIEDAGFEVRDAVLWHYGSGFPKSHDVSKGMDRAGGQPWAKFASMLDGLIKTAGFNYTSLDRALGIPSAGSNSCYWVRTDERGGLPPRQYYVLLKELLNPPKAFTDLYDLAEREIIALERRSNAPSGIVGCGRDAVAVERKITAPATDAAKQWAGWGTALKPATEIICLARKPLGEATVASNVLRHGTGAINIDGCRIGAGADKATGGNSGQEKAQALHAGGIKVSAATDYTQGRWPANVAWSVPEDEYQLKSSITKEQKQELLRWMHENA